MEYFRSPRLILRDRDALAKLALDTWGEEIQLRMLQEECAELIVAIGHYLRKNRKESEAEVLEEAGDVRQLLYQLEVMFGKGRMDTATELAFSKLEKRIKECTQKKQESGTE